MCMCATRPVNAVRHHPFCTNRKYNHHHRRQSSQPNSINENVPPLGRRLAGESTLQSRRSGKWHKQSLPDNMSLFAPSSITTNNSQFLAAPLVPSRSRKSTTSRFLNGDVDISSDLEISFASNVSLNSPPRENASLMSECEPMDISPAPPIKSRSKPARPRAFTSGARLFGADISNSDNGSKNKSLMPSPSLGGDTVSSVRSSAKKIQRSALPTEWLAPMTHQLITAVCLHILGAVDTLMRISVLVRSLRPLPTMLWMLIHLITTSMPRLYLYLQRFICPLFPILLHPQLQVSTSSFMTRYRQVEHLNHPSDACRRNSVVRCLRPQLVVPHSGPHTKTKHPHL